MPYTFINLDGETVTVQNSIGRSIFRTNVVRPAPPKRPLQPQPQPTPVTASTQNLELEPTPASAPAIATTASPLAEHTPSRTNDTRHEPLTEPPLTTELLDDLFGPSYADGINIAAFAAGVDADWTESRKEELEGLMENGVFKIVKRTDLKGVRVFGSRFVDTIKGGKRKSRLVAQNFADFAAGAVPTRAPTISRAAERVCLSFAASIPGNKTYVRDVSQAYTQADDDLDRLVAIEAPEEMGLGVEFVLLCVRPLYGIPESGLYWFLTYTDHHVQELQMTQSRADRCLFIRRPSNEDPGTSITAIQVDDSFGTASETFLQDEENAAKRFKTKPRIIIPTGGSVLFNGSLISQPLPRCYSLSQETKLSTMSHASCRDELVSTRAAIQYVGGSTRPDLSAPCQLLASAVAKEHPKMKPPTNP
jgi:hypothetical protein